MIAYKRERQRGQREHKLENLPTEKVEYRLPEEDQVCSCCGGQLHEMNTETRQELEIIPAQVKLKNKLDMFIVADTVNGMK